MQLAKAVGVSYGDVLRWETVGAQDEGSFILDKLAEVLDVEASFLAGTYTRAVDSIAGRVVEARTAAGLTQHQLSVAVGVSRESVYAWETSARQPQLRHVEPLARALGVSIEWLVTGKRETPQTYQQAVIAQEPVAYWRLNDAIGANTASAVIGAPGTYVNGRLQPDGTYVFDLPSTTNPSTEESSDD